MRKIGFHSLVFLILASNLSAPCAELSYLAQVNEIYKSIESQQIDSWNVQQNSTLFPGLRSSDLALLHAGVSVDSEKKTELMKQLAEVEKSEGLKSPRCIPLLVKLSMLSGQDEDSLLKLNQRVLEIAENCYGSTKLNSTDLAMLIQFLSTRQNFNTRVVLGSRFPGSGANVGEQSLTERRARLIYKMQLRQSGYRGVASLESLCGVLQSAGKTDEALALYKAAVAYLETVKQPDKSGIEIRILHSYMNTLQRSGKLSEAASLKQRLDSEEQKQRDKMADAATLKLEEAKKRQEVDPVGYASSLLALAGTKIQQDKRAEALDLFKQAIGIYLSISPEDDTSELSDSLWSLSNSLLSSANTKADELVVYGMVDAYEKKESTKSSKQRYRGRDELDEALRHFSDLHRTGDAIKLASYAYETRKKLQPKNIEAILQYSKQLCQLYEEAEEYDKAEGLALEEVALTKAADAPNPKVAPQIEALLDLSNVYLRQQKNAAVKATYSQALELAMKSENLEDLSYMEQLASQLVNQNRLKEADALIRHESEILSKPDSTNASSRASGFSRLGAGSSSVHSIINGYQQSRQFAEAESLIDFLSKSSLNDSRADAQWFQLKSELYLQQAKALKDDGKAAASAEMLAKSKLVFGKYANTLLSNPGGESYLKSVQAQRQASLKRLGFPAD